MNFAGTASARRLWRMEAGLRALRIYAFPMLSSATNPSSPKSEPAGPVPSLAVICCDLTPT